MSATTYPLIIDPSSAGVTKITRTFKAEWTKLVTLRSAWRTVAGAVIISVGFGAGLVASNVSQ